jgi:hypothetical protein
MDTFIKVVLTIIKAMQLSAKIVILKLKVLFIL